MIIYDFDIVCVRIIPDKTNSPLVVNSDTVLTFAVTRKPIETIAHG
jgi:hypothetical protein